MFDFVQMIIEIFVGAADGRQLRKAPKSSLLGLLLGTVCGVCLGLAVYYLFYDDFRAGVVLTGVSVLLLVFTLWYWVKRIMPVIRQSGDASEIPETGNGEGVDGT